MCLIQQVLFPLLTKLLENISPADVGGMEETRMRASTLLSKVSTPLLPESSGETMFLKKTELCYVLFSASLFWTGVRGLVCLSSVLGFSTSFCCWDMPSSQNYLHYSNPWKSCQEGVGYFMIEREKYFTQH